MFNPPEKHSRQNNNWLTSQTLGSGVTTNYAYNPRGFLADLKTTAPQASGGAVIAEFGGTVGTSSALTYDAVGNRTKMSGTLNAVGGFQMLGNGASSSQYAYDAANELTQEQTTEPGNGSYTNSYAYDGAQNRTSLNGATIGHNPDNQLSASGAYAYDGNGNPTTYTSPGNPVSGSANVNTFDPENRMTAYGVSGSSALLKAAYDSDGLRASKTSSSGVTTYYLYDQQEHPVVELNASGATIFVNTFGDNGLLSRRDVAGGVTTYYAFDPQGSAVDVMQNGNGLPAAYSAFGIPASGGAGSSPFGFGAQWGYYTDSETGLILCTHRYYDPYTGRWFTRDPISFTGGVNLYNYCRNNPVKYGDPLGLVQYSLGNGKCFDTELFKADLRAYYSIGNIYGTANMIDPDSVANSIEGCFHGGSIETIGGCVVWQVIWTLLANKVAVPPASELWGMFKSSIVDCDPDPPFAPAAGWNPLSDWDPKPWPYSSFCPYSIPWWEFGIG